MRGSPPIPLRPEDLKRILAALDYFADHCRMNSTHPQPEEAEKYRREREAYQRLIKKLGGPCGIAALTRGLTLKPPTRSLTP